jgi:hypothetical protein
MRQLHVVRRRTGFKDKKAAPMGGLRHQIRCGGYASAHGSAAALSRAQRGPLGGRENAAVLESMLVMVARARNDLYRTRTKWRRRPD